MKQAKQPSAKELEQGYELVPESTPTIQPEQQGRLDGKCWDVVADEDLD